MWIVFEATGGHLRPLYSENNIMEMLKGGDFVTMETVIIWGEVSFIVYSPNILCPYMVFHPLVIGWGRLSAPVASSNIRGITC